VLEGGYSAMPREAVATSADDEPGQVPYWGRLGSREQLSHPERETLAEPDSCPGCRRLRSFRFVRACPVKAACALVLASAALKVAAEVPVVAGELTRSHPAYDGL
jgi:hypothetical protein